MRYVGIGLLTLSVGLAPTLAYAAPPEEGGGDQTQEQGDGQAQGQGSEGGGDQSQSIDPGQGSGQGSNNNNSPNIIVQPQIQVQVQPTIDVSARPTAGADANTNANSNADADANGTISTDQKSSSQSDNAMDADIAGSNVNEGGVSGENGGVAGAAAPAGQARQPKKVVRKYVTTRVVYKPVHHRYHDHRRVQPERDDPRGVGAMIVGFGTFGGVYAHTAFNAAYLWDRCEVTAADVSECRKMPADMFIPVAGPFMAMQDTESAQNKVRLAALGGAQSAGLLLGLVGAIIYSRDVYKNRVLNEYGLKVSKKQDLRIAPNGAGVSLNLRF